MLLGPTGAGKTTTLRLVAGLERPDAGTIHIGGRDATTLDAGRARRGLRLPAIFALSASVGLRQPRLPAALAGAADAARTRSRRRVEEVAKLVRIDHKLDNRATKLSGGEMQRVAIGRALVRKPAIYLMDEPLSSLDAKLRADLRLELKRIQEELGATMLYVTHDQIEAMTMADRIGILADGVLVQIGTPREIYTEPANLHVAARLGQPAINLVAGRPAARCRRAGRHQDDRRAHRASADRARRRTATPTASSTGSSISATRTTCMSRSGSSKLVTLTDPDTPLAEGRQR